MFIVKSENPMPSIFPIPALPSEHGICGVREPRSKVSGFEKLAEITGLRNLTRTAHASEADSTWINVLGHRLAVLHPVSLSKMVYEAAQIATARGTDAKRKRTRYLPAHPGHKDDNGVAANRQADASVMTLLGLRNRVCTLCEFARPFTESLNGYSIQSEIPPGG